MKLTLGFSPCPNDTFIFDALVNNKIARGNIQFDVILEDVETLNKLALKNTLDISKISYGVLPLVLDNYIILRSGSALGSGVGPLLISNKQMRMDDINNYTIAIPGEHTTAHLLFNLAFPQATKKIFIRYDEIEAFISSDKNNKIAGVIIHENRFTYLQKGFIKIIDLGDFWEQKTLLPIPLGGIVAKRKMEAFLVQEINGLIKQSIQYAFSNHPVIPEYVRKHSQEMHEDVMRKHIDLYVNEYSLDLGEKGKIAIQSFLNIHRQAYKELKQMDLPVFMN